MHSTSSSENWPSGVVFFVADPELLFRVFVQFLAAHQHATDVGAYLHVILAHRLAMQHRIIADHFIHLQRCDAAALGHFVDQFRRNRSHFVLCVNQHRDHGRPLSARPDSASASSRIALQAAEKSHLIRVSQHKIHAARAPRWNRRSACPSAAHPAPAGFRNSACACARDRASTCRR